MMGNNPVFNVFDNIFADFIQFAGTIIKKLTIELALLRA